MEYSTSSFCASTNLTQAKYLKLTSSLNINYHSKTSCKFKHIFRPRRVLESRKLHSTFNSFFLRKQGSWVTFIKPSITLRTFLPIFFISYSFFPRLEKWNQKKLWSSILAARKWTSTVPLALVAGLKALALPCISAKETLSKSLHNLFHNFSTFNT